MIRSSGTLVPCFSLLSFVLLSGCDKHSSDTPPLTKTKGEAPTLITPEKVTITPDVVTLTKGTTTTLIATAMYADHQELVSDTITWKSMTPSIVIVSSDGVITGVAVGKAKVSAIFDGLPSKEVSVNVVPPLPKVDSIQLSVNGLMQAVKGNVIQASYVYEGEGSAEKDSMMVWQTKEENPVVLQSVIGTESSSQTLDLSLPGVQAALNQFIQFCVIPKNEMGMEGQQQCVTTDKMLLAPPQPEPSEDDTVNNGEDNNIDDSPIVNDNDVIDSRCLDPYMKALDINVNHYPYDNATSTKFAVTIHGPLCFVENNQYLKYKHGIHTVVSNGKEINKAKNRYKTNLLVSPGDVITVKPYGISGFLTFIDVMPEHAASIIAGYREGDKDAHDSPTVFLSPHVINNPAPIGEVDERCKSAHAVRISPARSWPVNRVTAIGGVCTPKTNSSAASDYVYHDDLVFINSVGGEDNFFDFLATKDTRIKLQNFYAGRSTIRDFVMHDAPLYISCGTAHEAHSNWVKYGNRTIHYCNACTYGTAC